LRIPRRRRRSIRLAWRRRFGRTAESIDALMDRVEEALLAQLLGQANPLEHLAKGGVGMSYFEGYPLVAQFLVQEVQGVCSGDVDVRNGLASSRNQRTGTWLATINSRTRWTKWPAFEKSNGA